ncbi:type II toxin-antitoxin system HicB family antitoxin [Fodinicurvata sp. EGI_FJ10296]|uniref:type II toxin-antitoxin system HicB family antitoxin n=1 Tax=Fodinicurvata sp. EGI_FJ10296 TaxID=3231908 RepID=UPI003455555C
MTRFDYPCTIKADPDGGFRIRFPDIPEAISEADTRNEVNAMAVDALIAALSFYIDARETLPEPSPAQADQVLVGAPPLTAAKLALYQAMREQRVTNVELARRLGVSETVVRRLLDLDHRSHIGQLDQALSALGRRMVVTVQPAA